LKDLISSPCRCEAPHSAGLAGALPVKLLLTSHQDACQQIIEILQNNRMLLELFKKRAKKEKTRCHDVPFMYSIWVAYMLLS